MTVTIKEVPTKPFEGQRPGTSGLRKKVKVFQEPNYTENFVQCILDAIPEGAKGATLVVGGDGRYFMEDAIQIIFRLGVANGVSKFIVGQNGILSTPAASNIIRTRKATGGIILTASHNPGGPTNDFGIKYNMANGGPAPEAVTEAMFAKTKTISSYKSAEIPKVDLSKVGVQKLDGFEVEVIDSVDTWLEMCKGIFDFDLMRNYFKKNPNKKILIDSMHGVTGPYAKRIAKELGLPETAVMNGVPLPDFGGGHPDPNLTYAHDLVERVHKEGIDFGAASDGDGDRNMIVSKDWFVTPSDSVAMIAAHAQSIPYFQKKGVSGLARSMPTSCALDRVAAKKGLQCYEVPTGWKFFGNLMDAGKCVICGEESFGTGSDHVREKDGLWAVLAWINILAAAAEKDPNASIRSIALDHFKTYGRNYFSRYDYEEVESAGADKMVENLRKMIADKSLIGKKVGEFTVKEMDDFTYHDPVDGSVSAKQGIRIIFDDGSRVVFRLSGTGSSGATVRLYVEKYEADPAKYDLDTQAAMKSLIDVALDISKLKEYTGRDKPTVIT